MAQDYWFIPLETMFYEALDYYDLSGWSIEPMPNNIDTSREALMQGQRKWPFRTHNARAKFKCRNCGKKWTSSYTTVIWRARWSTGIVQIIIEKQGCQRCNTNCQGILTDEDEIEFALDWMCIWILDVFYGIRDEDTHSGDDEPDDDKESKGPHDYQRCAAGRKRTCRKCNKMRRRRNPNHT
ncbi:unnamed protein product [Rotaria sp. Silwood1]|nr:unnamed protein product [Rotaria sp. Silwood1]CAF1637910.1 unnamed protein product [Rotaria sp. Silwood1]CAF4795715.1 unnamed protein product [Rotaria sp. Silwood1]